MQCPRMLLYGCKGEGLAGWLAGCPLHTCLAPMLHLATQRAWYALLSSRSTLLSNGKKSS